MLESLGGSLTFCLSVPQEKHTGVGAIMQLSLRVKPSGSPSLGGILAFLGFYSRSSNKSFKEIQGIGPRKVSDW